ncbi:DUF6519 domain-containing protein [Rhodococcus sp. T2V]|uniref:DUF6519 domain-containing protein n=1 Tax=Rhodococcus sp. T2V TaxID=3034164 RepID=UPI0023E0C58A|nr:DUF6519 domain-containing protein [Rhodococcus sp. T2V]MDF3308896.1 DUF6519 domain-containing protein [Rhodococcus sp. T2V]
MGLDYSRIRFDARRDFLGVLMQQGRVQLDSDWNDWVAELSRRMQAGALDTVGRAVVPRETADGFLIEAAGGGLTIGAGRMYVDGLLAENHGAPPADEWNPRLAELTSTDPVDYTVQPYLPNPPALPASPGPHLVYLDVWQREVGLLQDPDLIESAVGVDSTGRLQTVWQVKVLAGVGDVTCASDDADVPNWPDTIRPSGARLTTSTGTVSEPPNPCQVPPGAGYSGLENQLYRVEIHTPGPLGTATFKWSRDNATVATRVTHVNAAGDQLTVESTGRDDVLRFNDGDWIEVTDDWLELHNQPGELRRIKLAGGVDDVGRTIELESPVTAALFPVDAQNATDPGRHTLIRRWDQGGQVRNEDGTAYADLDAAGSTGDIVVPPASSPVFLEYGVLVDFDLDPVGGEFRPGDYWVVAARAVDASIDELDRAAPLGIHHHYARLAMVTFPDDETDCRMLWPPLTEGESCDCTVCVTPDGHNSGTATIQQAVDSVQAVGGTICLGAGTYLIREPIQLHSAQSLRIRGQGWATILLARAVGTVIDVSGGSGIALENLSVIGGGLDSDDGRSVMVSATNVIDFRIQHCNVVGVANRDATTAALGFSGAVLGAAVTDCAFVAVDGVVSGPSREKYLLAAHLRIADNVLFCRQRGIVFEQASFYVGDCRLVDNLILGCADTALVAIGGTVPGSCVTIAGNAIHTQGTGIRAGTDDLSIRENQITGRDRERAADGIVLTRGLDPIAIDRLHVIGNRLLSIGGRGIVIEHRVETGMIKQNALDGTGGAGLTVEPGGSLGYVSIENNRFADIGADENPDLAFAGLQIVAADRVDLVGNVVEGVGRQALANPFVAGIAAGAVGELRATGNRLRAIGPETSARLIAGIYVAPPVPQVTLDDNSVHRTGDDQQPLVPWAAILIFPVSWTDLEQAENAGFDASGPGIGSFKFAHAETSTFLLSPTHLTAISTVPSEVSVRGNRLQGGDIRVPLVVIGGGVGTCLFSDNHCRVAGQVGNEPVHGSLAAVVNNVANNRLTAETDAESLHLINGNELAVVLGNISSGRIRVNGAAVPAPFDQLNLLAL